MYKLSFLYLVCVLFLRDILTEEVISQEEVGGQTSQVINQEEVNGATSLSDSQLALYREYFGDDNDETARYIQDNNPGLVDYIVSNVDAVRNETVDLSYCLNVLKGDTYAQQFGPLGAIIDMACQAVPVCDMYDLANIITSVAVNAGIDAETLKKLDILLGGIVGGSAAAEGGPIAETIGSKVGACVVCLSVAEETWEQMISAADAVAHAATTSVAIAQETIQTSADEITKSAVIVKDGLNDGADAFAQGTQVVGDSFQDITTQIQEGFTFISIPDIPGVEIHDIPSADIPDIPGVKTPDLLGVKIPDIPEIPIPDIPDIPIPDIPDIPIPDIPVPDFPW